MIYKEKEICQYMGIPSIPKRKWDGTQSFARGCAIINHDKGESSYAVATFDGDVDNKPRIIKVFSIEQYHSVGDIFIVPPYMDTNVEEMDLDEESKEMAKALVEEAKDIELGENDGDFQDGTNENEYFFDNIKNDEQAIAFIRSYNKKNKIKRGGLPRTHEGIIVRLSVIYNELNKK